MKAKIIIIIALLLLQIDSIEDTDIPDQCKRDDNYLSNSYSLKEKGDNFYYYKIVSV